MADIHGNGLRCHAVTADLQPDDAGSAVNGLRLVEDEIADAVEDLVTAEVLDGLEAVGVVADKDVGTGKDELVGLMTLKGYRLKRVLAAPVERDDDDGGGVGTAQPEHPFHEGIHRFLADAGLVRQVGKVLEGKTQGRYEPDMARLGGQEHGLGSFGHRLSCADGHHSRLFDIPLCINQSIPPLVDGVVVSEVQVGDAMLTEGVEPFWFGAEDETLEDGCLNLSGWTLEIAHDNLCRTKHGVDAIRKEMADSVTVDDLAHPAVEEDVASQDNVQRIGGLRRHVQRQANSQSYRKSPHWPPAAG